MSSRLARAVMIHLKKNPGKEVREDAGYER